MDMNLGGLQEMVRTAKPSVLQSLELHAAGRDLVVE